MSYKMTHPDSGQEIEVETDQAPLYLSQGWLPSPNANPIIVGEHGPELVDLPPGTVVPKPKKK